MAIDQRKTRKNGYYATGEPSVTTILGCLNKPALNTWLCKQTFHAARNGCRTFGESQKEVTKISQKACRIGRDVHKFVELKAKGRKPQMQSNYLEYYQAFNEWLIDYKPEFVASEITVTSKKNNYKGTVDLLARVKGKDCLVDLKTGKYIYETVELQTSAYKQAYEEQGLGEIEETWCLLLEKGRDGLPTGEYKFEKLRYKPEVFNSLCRIHHWLNEE